MPETIDLNSDLGESFGRWTLGDDAAVLVSISSANVACGFHAGDPMGIRSTCAAAVSRGVTIGAHPGYRDLAGFGRRFLDVGPRELADEVVYQIGALQALARAEGGTVAYVKPHGALGHAIVHHEGHAQAVVDAVRSIDKSLPILAMPDAVVHDLARRAGLRSVVEAFADRAYLPDGRLAPRAMTGAVLHDLDDIAERVVRLALRKEVVTIDGSIRSLDAESICVHGDTPGAVEIATRVRDALTTAGIGITSFA